MRGVRFFGDGVRTQLGHHAEQPAPDPLHRQHPRRARHRREHPVLTVGEPHGDRLPDASAVRGRGVARRRGDRRSRVGHRRAATSSPCPPTRCTAWRRIRFRRTPSRASSPSRGARPARALPLVAADTEQVARRHRSARRRSASRLAAAFWPGPLTLLLAAPPALADRRERRHRARRRARARRTRWRARSAAPRAGP